MTPCPVRQALLSAVDALTRNGNTNAAKVIQSILNQQVEDPNNVGQTQFLTDEMSMAIFG